ncbi:ATP-dependent RNA helicase HrpA [Corynebacterium sp. zg-331]|uniref:ATP-dependent RNA helicase HrpA n=1 Tax=unclassified Corynebacterium TaxID=2624378 RepID=UPI00128D8772|nr:MULTISPECIES: ATP-dependent RNA helicase HrpA [unclassified Corynebacterium]MBC3185401.1 ATP-dependent RNA helicase HrpA [Corynebacterium sp. zg-331]MPV51896.1 ATP-dependent RNA helicase HrpA [Corynebacterium sp. zg331]
MNTSSIQERIATRLPHVPLAQERSLRRRFREATTAEEWQALDRDVESGCAEVARRAAAIPEISYPNELPVSARHDDIAAAIRDHQVVIIAGETGSGKTTQIPKICLELGFGRRGIIGHTQPRRLAARTVAERIAEELGQDIGQSVGYAIRFDDRVGPDTAVKLMTDGILLAEMQRDRFFRAYDVIIIDEAHERSLNIDFLLGYLKRILPQRPDLKVIITSATIDPERFARHFADAQGNPAPIVEVSGRTYPVEIRYRPTDEDPDALVRAIEELMAEGPGDILCFFPSERDIRDAMELLEAQRWSGTHILPLFGRLSNQEQHRVFSPHSGRRIVLSTNIAETSLTVPGIHYVVDTGTARISRYSTRTKVQRLPIEAISQASANQRSGRCGRVAEGVAIRLYSEEDFLSRPEFTDPEILRTNLASVILQMASLRLGDIAQFPFVQPPEARHIRDGLALLHELGAISPPRAGALPKLTRIGRDLARIPVDPRLARMLVEAQRLGCLHEVIVIVAALTTQDIRERPLDHQAQADQLHARFRDKKSDFLSYLKLWEYLDHKRQELSGNGLRRLMKAEFLHYMRSREWRDLVRQLREVSRQLGWNIPDPTGNAEAIHSSLLAGLLMNIGQRDGNSKEFRGTRNTRFMVFPGSALAKKPPEFVMAAELVETSRLWARDVAAIDPAWVERLAGTLLKRQYSDPVWSRSRATAVVQEKATLYGVTIYADRTVPYHRVDPEAARGLFIRHALVEGDWATQHRFFHDNAAALAQAAEVEDKARRRGLVADEDVLYEFYEQRIPASITTGAHFDSWWKKKRRADPHALTLTSEALLHDAAQDITQDLFPDHWDQFRLEYSFAPGTKDDGVRVLIPVPMLASIDPAPFQWLVPGMRVELVTELIRGLPKGLRRSVVPAPTFAERVVPLLDPREDLCDSLAAGLRRLGGTGIDTTDFSLSALPTHLRMTFAAVNKCGKIIDADKDIRALARRQATQIRSSMDRLSNYAETTSAEEWTEETLGTLPQTVQTSVDGHSVTAYPTLQLRGKIISVAVLPTKAAADQAMFTTTLTLLMRAVSINAKQMTKGLVLQQRVALEHYPHGGVEGIVEEARVAAIRDLLLAAGGPVRSPEKFAALRDSLVPQVTAQVRRSIVTIAPALVSYERVANELSQWEGPAIDDMQAELHFLLPPKALIVHGMNRLKHLPRYLQAMTMRLAEMNHDPDKDAARQEEVDAVMTRLRAVLAKRPEGMDKTTPVKDVLWMIEEFRVSLFAQRLGTAQPVSRKRIMRAIDRL